MPGNASAGQLIRDESVLDSMTRSPGGARGCHSDLEDEWNQPFIICFLVFLERGARVCYCRCERERV